MWARQVLRKGELGDTGGRPPPLVGQGRGAKPQNTDCLLDQGYLRDSEAPALPQELHVPLLIRISDLLQKNIQKNSTESGCMGGVLQHM